MRGYGILYTAFRDSRTPDNKRDADVFFVSACFSGWEAVLADVESVVGCVDYVCVFCFVAFFQAMGESVD